MSTHTATLRRREPGLALLVALIALPQLGETIFTPSLAEIATFFSVTEGQAQSTLSWFFAGFAVGIFAWGWLSDAIGRRNAMLTSLFVYCVGCVACVYAQDFTSLLAGRVVQGFGAASCSVVVQAICREAFNNERKLHVFALIGMFIPLSTAVGPFVGGWLAQLASWRISFSVLLGAGVLLLIWCTSSLPETRVTQAARSVGLFTLIGRMLTDARLWGMMLVIGLLNGMIFSFYGEAPFLMIQLRGLSSGAYGTLTMVAVLGSAVGGMAMRRLAKRGVSTGALIMTGLALVILATGGLALSADLWVQPGNTPALIAFVGLAAVMFCGFTISTIACLYRALEHYQDALGRAGALFGLAYYAAVAGVTAGLGMWRTGAAVDFPLYALMLAGISVLAHLVLIRSRLN